MKDCCKCFFETEGLQGELNIPMQFCPYCGHKLTDREFEHFNKTTKMKEILKKGHRN